MSFPIIAGISLRQGTPDNPVVFTPDQSAVGNRTTGELWSTDSGARLFGGMGRPDMARSISPDWHWMAVAGNNVLTLYGVPSGTEAYPTMMPITLTPTPHYTPTLIPAPAVTPIPLPPPEPSQGQEAITANTLDEVTLLTTLAFALSECDSCGYGPLAGVQFSPDGRMLAGYGGHDIALWDSLDGSEIGVLTDPQGDVTAILFSPDSHLLAARDQQGQLIVWDVDTLDALWTSDMPLNTDAGRPLFFTTDSQFLVTSTQIWQVQTGAIVGREDVYQQDASIGPEVVSLLALQGIEPRQLSPNRRWTITPSGAPFQMRDARSGLPVAFFSGHLGGTTAAVFSADNAEIVSLGQDDALRVWDIASETLLTSVTGVDGNQIAVDPHAEVAATGFELMALASRGTRRALPTPFRYSTLLYANSLDTAFPMFSPDGATLAVYSRRYIVLYGIPTLGRPVYQSVVGRLMGQSVALHAAPSINALVTGTVETRDMLISGRDPSGQYGYVPALEGWVRLGEGYITLGTIPVEALPLYTG